MRVSSWMCAIIITTCLSALSGTALALPITLPIAYSGFNDASGLGSDPLADSPYALGKSVRDYGAGEIGWGSNLWNVAIGGSPTTQSVAVVETGHVWEGDGALHLYGNGSSREVWAYRWLNSPQTAPFWIEQYVSLPSNAFFQSRPGLGGTGSLIGPHWRVENNRFYAGDGDGKGGVVFLDTGITAQPLQWYKISLLIDPVSKTYEFYLNDQKFHSPDPLGFRGSPSSIQVVEYLTQSEVYVDAIRVNAVPEPSALVLLAVTVVCPAAFAMRRRNRKT